MSILGRHILCVDDNRETCDLLTLWLEKVEGCYLTVAETVAEGLQLAKSTRFDLYLVDEWLPDGTGEELCMKLREFDATTPIVIHSADARAATKERLLSTCAQAFVTKPGDLDVLSRTIARQMAKSTGH
ncbi:MAG TPA: response regulator [Blastocatellia bacterium]|nr:response regulator [Blastocatellia bacterium]